MKYCKYRHISKVILWTWRVVMLKRLTYFDEKLSQPKQSNGQARVQKLSQGCREGWRSRFNLIKLISWSLGIVWFGWWRDYFNFWILSEKCDFHRVTRSRRHVASFLNLGTRLIQNILTSQKKGKSKCFGFELS